MSYKTDIEIAQETQIKPISEIAGTIGIDEKYVENYGRYKAKIDCNLLRDVSDKPDGN
jgi:formate--tetrahydrofolate ligase